MNPMGFRGKVEEIMPTLNSDMVIDQDVAHKARLTIVRQHLSADEMIDLMEMLGIMPDKTEKRPE